MPRFTPIPAVLNRPNLILGGERGPIIMICGSCIGITGMSMNWITTFGCIALWLIVVPLLRVLAREDPDWIGVYIRSLFYRRRYSARSRPAASEATNWRRVGKYAGLFVAGIVIWWWIL